MTALVLYCADRPIARPLTSLENRRTLEGFDASLTAKKAALQVLFTFAPAMYVGLAGERPPHDDVMSHELGGWGSDGMCPT